MTSISLTAEELKSLKDRAMMAEKWEGLFSVRIGVVGGHLDDRGYSRMVRRQRRRKRTIWEHH
jgi:hypothetical protein